MLWKRGNHNQIHRNTEQISTDIAVRTDGFYFHEKPANPANQLLCVEPRYEDSDPGFPQFMRLCSAQSCINQIKTLCEKEGRQLTLQ